MFIFKYYKEVTRNSFLIIIVPHFYISDLGEINLLPPNSISLGTNTQD